LQAAHHPGSNLDSLPFLDTPDKLVVHAYAALIGELLYIAINTVPQLSSSMSCLTRYMSKAAPTHLTYAKVVLHYLIGISGRKHTWCGKRVSLLHVISEILAYVSSSWADDKNNRRSSIAYHLFVNNATFSWRATLSQIVALSTTEAELMPLASCCCGVVWARKLAVELGFRSSNLPISTKTTPVVLPWQTTCIYVGAASMLPFVCASFNNSFKTESSMLNNALLQRK